MGLGPLPSLGIALLLVTTLAITFVHLGSSIQANYNATLINPELKVQLESIYNKTSELYAYYDPKLIKPVASENETFIATPTGIQALIFPYKIFAAVWNMFTSIPEVFRVIIKSLATSLGVPSAFIAGLLGIFFMWVFWEQLRKGTGDRI